MAYIEGVPSNIALLAGPLFLGNMFGYGLYGILVVQIFIYSHRFQGDPLWIKTLVLVLFSVETVLTVLGTAGGWKILVSGWGDPATLVPFDWTLASMPLLSGLVASSVQFFYCWRIYKLRQLVVIPITLATISVVACGMSGICGIRGHKLGMARLGELKPWAIVWLGGSTLVDVLITICMVTLLFRARSRTYFKETSSLIQKLIALTIETAMITGVTSVVHAVLFAMFPSINLHFSTFLMLAKLYSNTLLATLNARALMGTQDAVAAPALWTDSTNSSQWTSNNEHLVIKRSMQGSLSTASRNSQRVDQVELGAPVFVRGSQLSLDKYRTASPLPL